MSRYEQKCSQDTIYYNLNLYNDTDVPIPAEIMEKRNSPILQVPLDYQLSVVRFQIDASLIPIFFPIIPDPVGSPNTTDMSITLSFGATDIQVYVVVSAAQVRNGIYSFQNYLDSINDAALAAFMALKVLEPTIAPISPPRFWLNPQTNLISMFVERGYQVDGAFRPDVYFNHNLMRIINLPAVDYFGNNQPDGKDFLVQISDSAILIPAQADRVNYPVWLSDIAVAVLQVQQEYFSLYLWNSLRGVLFTSNMLPIEKEFTPDSNTLSQNDRVNSGSLGVITDFEINKDSTVGGIKANIIQYTPTAEYRMISLQGSNPIDTIDLRAFYSDTFGRLYPIRLDSRRGMTVKLMFRRG